VEEGILKLESRAYGSTKVTITALDPAQEKVSSALKVLCRNPEQKVDLYPTPVPRNGVLNIRMGAEVNGLIDVMLHNASGAKVFSERVRISSGEPSRVDLSKLNSGNYRVTVIYGSHKFTQNITKL
ncbi:MAG: T9SS type A sorting domain-containing protein, partial [Bacteroides sp.]